MGINDFCDLTFAEFEKLRLMAPQDCSATEHNLNLYILSEYDWVKFGVVTPVKNQGACGSCWTFSTVGSLESHWNILRKGKDNLFAEQLLVDCAGDFNNLGCNGGVKNNETSVTYPYAPKDGACVYRSQIAVGSVKHISYDIRKNDEDELAEIIRS